jgi:hypothetical protein
MSSGKPNRIRFFGCDLAIVASNSNSIVSRQVGGLEFVLPRSTLDWSWQVAGPS